MVDYWQAGTATTEAGAAAATAQPATNGDANMDDEILVSSSIDRYLKGTSLTRFSEHST
jgi:hypothetical protein